MQSEQIAWRWRGETIQIGIDWRGSGPSVLLLPALSSISTRNEMRPLQERLSAHYRLAAIDWPGFGDQSRPALDWHPDAYSAFLSFLLISVTSHPHAIIAAGHAAGYALKHVASNATATERLVLIAPTWRGPLPTMMGGHRPFFDRLCRLVDLPGIGPLIYRLNVNQPVVRHMGASHVYADRGFLAGERLREKLAVTQAPGARFASVRFVTGRLDPLRSRGEFLDLARRIAIPILLSMLKVGDDLRHGGLGHPELWQHAQRFPTQGQNTGNSDRAATVNAVDKNASHTGIGEGLPS